MDNLQDIQGTLFKAAHTLSSYMHDPTGPLHALLSLTHSTSQTLQHFNSAFLTPYVVRPTQALLNSPPTLGNLLALIVLVIVGLRLLDYTRRVVLFWIRVVVKTALWVCVGAWVWYGWTHGWGEAGKVLVDAVAVVHGVVVGVINGFMNGDVDVRGYYDRVAQGVEWQRLGYDGGDARGGQGQVPLRNWWRL